MRAKLIFISMVLSLPLVALFSLKTENNSKQDELILYCAAGLRLPIQKIVSDFENDYGVLVKIQFGGSGSLLANIEAINVIYGGSVNCENAKSFFQQTNIDGALIGGASLDGKNFLDIYNYFLETL